MSELIRTDKLSRAFKDGLNNPLLVLGGIDFVAHNGQKIAIVGASGSGKSVFLNLLGGMDSPSSGAVYYEGKKLADFNADQRAEWRNRTLGFVFQFYPLLKDFSCLENVFLPSLIAGFSKNAATQKARMALKKVGLLGRADFRANKLSGGEQQRVAIARAMINEPRLILADEPTGNLDPASGQNIIDVLTEQTKALDAAMVVVTHNRNLANQMDEVWELKNHLLTRVR